MLETTECDDRKGEEGQEMKGGQLEGGGSWTSLYKVLKHVQSWEAVGPACVAQSGPKIGVAGTDWRSGGCF